MVRGLYTAHTGMVNEQKRLDVISNNLANAATTGYKQDGVTSQSFDQMLTVKIRDGSEAYTNKAIGTMSLGVKLGEVFTDYSQGSFKKTENTYDLGISGNGFYSINVTDANGDKSIKYSRDGSFKMSEEGYIVDTEGNHLQGLSGDLQVSTSATEVTIDKMGFVSADGQVVDRITLVDFEDYNYLEKYGDNLYTAVDGATVISSNALIEQGYLEQSNVNVVSEMVDMITVTRTYEANQKVIQTVDSMLDKSVNSIGRV